MALLSPIILFSCSKDTYFSGISETRLNEIKENYQNVNYSKEDVIAIIGPQKTFYQLHEWAFTEKAQWFFYYQDSLMTTLMPEIVFADIAVLLGTVTIALWFFITLVLRRYLI